MTTDSTGNAMTERGVSANAPAASAGAQLAENASETGTAAHKEGGDARALLSEADRAFVDSLLDRILADTPTDADIQGVTAELGRYPRGMVAVGRRCAVCGTPLVTVTRPLVEGRIPFPTTFYLCSAAAVKAVGRVEAEGAMADYTELVQHDDGVRAAYERAHWLYLAFRTSLARRLGDTEDHIAGISVGGMPTRVKCLHALLAQTLVMGRGVNPIGDRALARIADEFSPDVCRCHR